MECVEKVVAEDTKAEGSETNDVPAKEKDKKEHVVAPAPEPEASEPEDELQVRWRNLTLKNQRKKQMSLKKDTLSQLPYLRSYLYDTIGIGNTSKKSYYS
jgi:hypothetical protein